MKIFLYIIILLYNFQLFAQIDAFESEVVDKNNLIYYNGTPLSGTLFSDDEIEIPNECQCTLLAKYKNGKLNGLKQEWYNNGKLKFKGKYINGKAEGLHIFYDKKGYVAKKKEFKNGTTIKETNYYSGGKIKSEVPYLNGLKQGTEKQFDNNGSIIKENKYNQDKLIKTIFYKDNQKESEIEYSQTHQVRRYYKNNKLLKESHIANSCLCSDGVTKIYDENGYLTEEYNYVLGKVKSYKLFYNNKKNGKWYHYNDDFSIKTVETYKNGELISTQTINSRNFIENLNISENDRVYEFYDELKGNKSYFIFKVDRDKLNNSNYSEILFKFLNQISKRTRIVSRDEYNGEKEVKAIIRLNNFKVKTEKEQYEKYKTVNNKSVKYYVTGYNTDISYNINVVTPEGNNIFSKRYSFDSKGGLGSELLSYMTNNYPETPEIAYKKTIAKTSIYDLLVDFFPVYAKIIKVEGSSSRISRVYLDKGYEDGIFLKSTFVVLDNGKLTPAKIKVTRAIEYRSNAKVIKEKKWLRSFINSNPNPLVKEYYKK